MKQTIKSLLKKAGWELRRVPLETAAKTPRATMQEGLRWLSEHQFEVGTVLDVGASDGRWSKECMRIFPDVSYALYEPQPLHSQKLDELAAESSQKVTPIKKAVGATGGVTYFDAADQFGGALAETETADTIEVELTSLDQSLVDYELKPPYLLKLDTHGFERSILAGATQTLAQSNVLIIESYNYRITEEAFLFWELCAYLAERGFQTVDLVDTLHRKYDSSLWQMDLIFVKSDWGGFQYISYR